ncbi:MAG TPA: hypothetical protein VKU44_00815 [Terriglobia bacterium]|nr:hypothetical protein [Terriglobia bacterium]
MPDAPAPPTDTAPEQPTKPPAATVRMVDRAGNPVDIPAEKVADAFRSKQYGFAQGSKIGVRGPNGELASIDAAHAHSYFAQPVATAASDQEVHQADLDERYGGVGGHLAAAGEGVARGISLGLSDPLAVHVAKMLGGEKTAEDVREHLAGEKEAHPYLSTAAEIAGAAAPIILSGGTAAAPEVAGGAAVLGEASEAGILSKLAEGIGSLGVAPRAVSALGDATEHAFAGVLGESGTVLGRATQAAAKAAVRGIVEGGLFGAGQEISESTLANQDLTAERILSSVGHGALMGGLLGAGVGAAGSLAKDAIGALGGFSEKLEEAAGSQAFGSLDAKGADGKAIARAGGASELGNTWMDEVVRPRVEEKGPLGAFMSNAEKQEETQAALNRIYGEVKEAAATTKATVDMADILKPIDDRIATFEGKIGHEDVVSKLQGLKDSIGRVMGGEEAGAAERTPEQIRAFIAEHPDQVKWSAGGSPILPEAGPVAKTISIPDMIARRQDLQDMAYRGRADPSTPIQALREISGEWNGLIEKAMNEASDDSAAGTELRALNKRMQKMLVIKDILDRNEGRYAKNDTISLTSKIMGASSLAGGLASGNPVHALASIPMALGSEAVKYHGNIAAALLLDRLGTIGGVSQTVADETATMERAVDNVLAGKGRPRLPRAFKTDLSEKRYKQEAERVQTLSQIAPGVVAGHLQDRTKPLATHLPNVAASVQQKATAATSYLASKLPPPDPSQSHLTPQLNSKLPPANAVQRASFLRAVDAVEKGPSGILDKLSRGQVHPEDVEALKQVYPETFKEIQTMILQRCADRKEKVPYQTRVNLGNLFEMPTDPTLEPMFRMAMQESYVTHPDQQTGGGGLAKTAPAKLSAVSALANDFDRPSATP